MDVITLLNTVLVVGAPCVFTSGYECLASASGNTQRRMLKVIKCFAYSYSFHLHGECLDKVLITLMHLFV
jgi:hypothetical protein